MRAERVHHCSTGPAAAGGGEGPWWPAGTFSASTLERLLAGNQFASGGLTLLLVGAAGAAAGRLATLALAFIKRRVLIRAEIDSRWVGGCNAMHAPPGRRWVPASNGKQISCAPPSPPSSAGRDDAYRWVMHWLSQHGQFRGHRDVSVTSNMLVGGAPLAAASAHSPAEQRLAHTPTRQQCLAQPCTTAGTQQSPAAELRPASCAAAAAARARSASAAAPCVPRRAQRRRGRACSSCPPLETTCCATRGAGCSCPGAG